MESPLAVLLPVLTLLLLLLPLPGQAIQLDIHIPLPDGCVKYHALLANRLLRQASRSIISPSSSDRGRSGADDLPIAAEEVNLFSLHTPHITLYLADFDLEISHYLSNQDNTGASPPLNNTKVSAFLNELSSIHFTEILTGMDCALSFYSKDASNSFYVINGAYTMLPIANTPCLQTLSDTVLDNMKSYLRRPAVVPDWVAELPEPSRSAAIDRSREYGSPNVLDGFDPHVTVGYDHPPRVFSSTRRTTTTTTTSQQTKTNVRSSAAVPSSQRTVLDHGETDYDLQWRTDAMKHWNDLYLQRESFGNHSCANEVRGIALGKVGVGGTVLANSRLGYWSIDLPPKDVS